MKVFVQVVNTKTGGYQHEMIDEPVKSGLEVLNALKHFGIDDVDWVSVNTDELWLHKFGVISGTTKAVSVIIILVVYDQPSLYWENRSVIGSSS